MNVYYTICIIVEMPTTASSFNSIKITSTIWFSCLWPRTLSRGTMNLHMLGFLLHTTWNHRQETNNWWKLGCVFSQEVSTKATILGFLDVCETRKGSSTDLFSNEYTNFYWSPGMTIWILSQTSKSITDFDIRPQSQF